LISRATLQKIKNTQEEASSNVVFNKETGAVNFDQSYLKKYIEEKEEEEDKENNDDEYDEDGGVDDEDIEDEEEEEEEDDHNVEEKFEEEVANFSEPTSSTNILLLNFNNE
jgi:hypothetical protein